MSVHTEHNQEDIYRGSPPHYDLPDPAPSISSASASSVSSSSSSSFLAGGRIGAIAAKLELAITRWSRNVRGNSSNASDSSSSSSSSSSRSSVITLTKSQLARRRRKRPRSISSLRTMLSERDIAARITRMKALERSRQIPREFALYLPSSIMPAVHAHQAAQIGTDAFQAADRRITWTTSLPLVLAQLDIAIRKPARHRHPRPRNKFLGLAGAASESPPTPAHFVPRIQRSKSSTPRSMSSSPIGIRKGRKGKERATPEPRLAKPAMICEKPQVKPQAWFLDVANPTWADLRAIGKLLHIHPLTLEDILQQDPREKLELFSKLGYYFISFRAIESQATRDKIRRETRLMETPNKSALDEGPIGEANVYLTVFKDGICCFHFTDVSEHTNRVRNRLLLREELVNKSSDWITHNILDSIVDSFFPFLEEIEKEAVAIDHIVYSGEPDLSVPAGPSVELARSTTSDFTFPLKQEESPLSQAMLVKEKYYAPAEKARNSYRPHFASPRLNTRLFLRRIKRRVANAWTLLWVRPQASPSGTQLTLRRMARTRKLVTALGRLLASKSDVVTQIQKRLARAATEGHSTEEFEVAIYMGDVQDHILTLQHSLAHYERMLCQSHPTYLAQLRTMSETSKGSTDMNVLLLTVVTLSVLCLQTLTGLFSLNVTIPANALTVGSPHNVFGVVISLAVVILISYISLVRYWWKNAKRRRTSL